MENMLDKFAEAADGLAAVPNEDAVEKLREKSLELHNIEKEMQELETKLSNLTKQRYKLKNQELPDAMRELGLDILGVPQAGVNVVLSTYCKASIPKSWDEERKQDAFNHLESMGGGDLVKLDLTVKAGRGSLESMRQLNDRVRQLVAEYNIPGVVTLEPSVQWNSLTSFVKQCIKDGEPINMDAVGATYGDVVNIVDKKE